MTGSVDHISGVTYHGRKGEVTNAFRYSVDYMLLDAEAPVTTPSLFARNGRSLMALDDIDHGGPPKDGRGAAWVRDVLQSHQVTGVARIELLAQPKVLGHVGARGTSYWNVRLLDHLFDFEEICVVEVHKMTANEGKTNQTNIENKVSFSCSILESLLKGVLIVSWPI